MVPHGIIGKRIHPLAANTGLVAGVLVNLIMWLFFKNIFWFWWNAIGKLVTLGLGTGLSLVMVTPAAPKLQPDAPMKLLSKENVILLIFFGCIILFSFMLPQIL